MAALCRPFSLSRHVSRTHNSGLDSRCVLLYHSSLKSRRTSLRAFGSSEGRDESRKERNKPRIHLSRKQIRRLWEDLGRDEAGDGLKADRISVDPSEFPVELFEHNTPASMVQGRISVDPDKFPLDLFDSHSAQGDDRFKGGDDKSVFRRLGNLNTSQQEAALDDEIVWHLKRARRDSEPHKYVEKAQSILELWHEKAEKETSYPMPSWYAHESILRGWKRIGLDTPDPYAAQRADKVLQLLLNLVDEGKLKVQGSLGLLFMWVIRLWLRAPQRDPRRPQVAELLLDSATRASELLLDLERRCDILEDEHLCKPPESATYLSILNAFNQASMAASKFGRAKRRADEDRFCDAVETAARKSEEVLMRMEELSQTLGTDFVPPDAYAYRAVLSMWSNVKTPEGVARATGVLQRMEKSPHLKDSGDNAYRRILLHTYALMSRLYEYDPQDSEAPANKAIAVLTRMDPELHSRIQDLDNFSVSSDGEGMIDNVASEQTGDAVCYGTVIQALAQAEVGPSMTALDVTPATLAETVLERMNELYSAGELDEPPNSHCYGNLIRALSLWANRSADKTSLTSRMELILKMLEDHILRGEMVSASTSKVTKWYNHAISIVAQTSFGGSPSRADKVLERMEELCASAGWSAERTIICPDEASYCLILSALEASSHSSGDLQTAQHAVNVLRRMITMHEQELQGGGRRKKFLCRPSTVAHNIVLRTCAAVTGEEADKQEAFHLASQVFDDLQNSPYTFSNSTSYGLIIKAHGSLLSAGAERDEGISMIVRRCRNDEKLDNLVMKAVREACSEDTVATLLDSSPTAT